jgi:hypothetical protein
LGAEIGLRFAFALDCFVARHCAVGVFDIAAHAIADCRGFFSDCSFACSLIVHFRNSLCSLKFFECAEFTQLDT